jgi:hypothetical protein
VYRFTQPKHRAAYFWKVRVKWKRRR